MVQSTRSQLTVVQSTTKPRFNVAQLIRPPLAVGQSTIRPQLNMVQSTRSQLAMVQSARPQNTRRLLPVPPAIPLVLRVC